MLGRRCFFYPPRALSPVALHRSAPQAGALPRPSPPALPPRAPLPLPSRFPPGLLSRPPLPVSPPGLPSTPADKPCGLLGPLALSYLDVANGYCIVVVVLLAAVGCVYGAGVAYCRAVDIAATARAAFSTNCLTCFIQARDR